MQQEDFSSIDFKKRKVEEIGVAFDKTGFPPMVGRVVGFLLLADPPFQTFYAIQEFLGASKSSISNALNVLMEKCIVDYVTFSGDRKRYFRLNIDSWLENTKEKMEKMSHVDAILFDALKYRDPEKYPEFVEGLKKILSFHMFIAEEMPKLIAKWEAMQRDHLPQSAERDKD